MKWYVGQKIVAIRDHPMNGFSKGDEFTIISLKESLCLCNKIHINIGKDFPGYTTQNCLGCHVIWPVNEAFYFKETYFAPLDEISDYTIESLIEDIEESEFNKIDKEIQKLKEQYNLNH